MEPRHDRLGTLQQVCASVHLPDGGGIGDAALVAVVYSLLADVVPVARLGWIVALFSAGSCVGVGIACLFGEMLMVMLRSVGARGVVLAPGTLFSADGCAAE
ncbi:MAG: hypothetical protein ABF479_20765 [Gluconacetobacter sp.]